MFPESGATGFIPGTKLAPTNLVISHKLRVWLNSKCNEADAVGRDGVVRITRAEFGESSSDEEQGKNTAQDALFWPGMRVIGYGRGSARVKNGLLYEIIKLGALVTLRAQGAEEFELPMAKFSRSVRLSYALTQAGVQGLTLDGLISVWNASHPHFDRRKLYVCVSRARRSDQLIVR